MAVASRQPISEVRALEDEGLSTMLAILRELADARKGAK